MRLTRAAGWLAMVMAAAFVVGDVWGVLRAEVTIPLVPAATALLPKIVAVAAGAVLVGGPQRWQRTAAAYLAVVGAHVAAALPGSISFAWGDAGDEFLWWRVAAGVLALGVAVLAVMLLRADWGGAPTPRPSRPLQWLGAVGGVVLAASGAFAWSATRGSAEAGLTIVIGRYGLDAFGVASILGMLVLLVATGASYLTEDRGRWLGLVGGLLAAFPDAVTPLLDPTRREAGVVMAPGWWLALAGQLVLVVVLVLALARGGAGFWAPRTR